MLLLCTYIATMAQKYDITCCALRSFSILIGLINNDNYIFSLLQIFIRCAYLSWEDILSVSWQYYIYSNTLKLNSLFCKLYIQAFLDLTRFMILSFFFQFLWSCFDLVRFFKPKIMIFFIFSSEIGI